MTPIPPGRYVTDDNKLCMKNRIFKTIEFEKRHAFEIIQITISNIILI